MGSMLTLPVRPWLTGKESTEPGQSRLHLQGSDAVMRTGGGLYAVLFLGNDLAEVHHDIELVVESGRGDWPAEGCPRAWRGWRRCTP